MRTFIKPFVVTVFTLFFMNSYSSEISTSSLDNIVKETKSTVNKPVIKRDKNRVSVSHYAFNKKEMSITIYYENDLILQDNLTGEKAVAKVYKLDKEQKGRYKIVIKTNGQFFTKSFSL